MRERGRIGCEALWETVALAPLPFPLPLRVPLFRGPSRLVLTQSRKRENGILLKRGEGGEDEKKTREDGGEKGGGSARSLITSCNSKWALLMRDVGLPQAMSTIRPAPKWKKFPSLFRNCIF